MKKSYLFSHKFRLIGWIMFPFFFIIGLYYIYNGDIYLFSMPVLAIISNGLGHYDFFEISYQDVTDEIILIGIVISLIFIAFSKEKHEDELTSHMRTKSLVWFIIFSYVILIIGTIFIYDFVYVTFLALFSFLPLLIFIIKYNWEKYKAGRQKHD